MEQGEHAGADEVLLDPSEWADQGGEASAVRSPGEGSTTEPERVFSGTGMGSPVDRGATIVSVREEDLEKPLPALGNGGGGGNGTTVSISIDIDGPGAVENPSAARFVLPEVRAIASNAAPPFINLRPSSRSRKLGVRSKYVAAGAAEFAGSETAPFSGASSSAPAIGPHDDQGSSASVTDPIPDVPAMADGDQGDRKKKRARFAFVSKVAIAHASPPDSYRRVPLRSRKQSSPKRFIALNDAPPAPPSSSSSYRLPCQSRKQPHPEHFIPVDSEVLRAKALRSNTVLEEFLSSRVAGTSARRATADEHGAAGQDPHSSSARAPGSSSPSPGEPGDGSGRVLGVLAVLAASLALSMVSCVLFYIVGERSQPPDPSGEQKKK